MEDKSFYDRLIAEKDELDARQEKLTAFLNSDKAKEIDPMQITLLRAQNGVMVAYSHILKARIELLG